MGISLPPFQPGQVLGGNTSAAPDALTTLLAALQQGGELGVRGMEEAGRNSRSSAENEIEKAKLALQGKQMDLEAADKKIELENAKIKGEALKQLLPHWIQTGQMAPPAQGQGQPQQPQPVPQGAQPEMQPMQGLQSVIDWLPPELRGDFLKDVLNPTQTAQKQVDAARAEQAKRAEFQRITTEAVAGLPEADRQTAMRALELGTLDLPEPVLAPMVKKLWGPEWTIEKAKLAMDLSREFNTLNPGAKMSIGEAAALLGEKAPVGLSKVSLSTPKEPWRPTVQQNVASAQFDVMKEPYKYLQSASTQGNPGFVASALRNFKGGSVTEDVLNTFLPPAVFSEADKKYLQSLRVFVDSYVRVVSGAQVNVDEFTRFMRSLGEASGDTQAVRQRKARARTSIMSAIFNISQQKIAGSASLDALLSSGDLGDLSREERAVFDKLKQDALTYEQTGRVRTNFSVQDRTPGGSDAAVTISNQIPVAGKP